MKKINEIYKFLTQINQKEKANDWVSGISEITTDLAESDVNKCYEQLCANKLYN